MVIEKEEAFNLIKRNTQEIVSEDELLDLLATKENPVAYWGTATTGRIHIGYFIPLTKIADFLNAGVTFKILLADFHAHLDDSKSPWDLLDARTEYYKQIIIAMLESLGADISKLIFIRGRDIELEKQYSSDLLRLSTLVTIKRAIRAGAEVVRQSSDPKIGGLIYPLMQTVDVSALKADIAYSGIDQRGIYMLSREVLPELGYKKPICVFTPMLPGLKGEKMSASDTASKIDCLDAEASITKKVLKSFCPEKQIEENGVILFVKTVLFPLLEKRNKKYCVERTEKFGGNIEFATYDELEKNFVEGSLHPQDFKKSVAKYVNILLEHVREKFEDKQDLLNSAYPE